MLDKSTNVFLKYDKDNSGFIDIKEMKNLLIDIGAEFGREPPSDEIVMKFFKIFDFDSNGKISKAELFDLLITLWGVTAPIPKSDE